MSDKHAQNLAIAYSLKKKAAKKKMAEGGYAESDEVKASHPPVDQDVYKKRMQSIIKMGKGSKMEDPQMMADGGFIEEEMASGDVDHEGNDVKHDEMAMKEDAHSMDMVDRIMNQRAGHYSEGGKVANESGIGRLSQMADDERNSFDDLVLRDDLESSYTGANSGDELGDAQEDHDRSDIVARIMSSRRKKDRMPRPA